mgnify:CR=1 FL=1
MREESCVLRLIVLGDNLVKETAKIMAIPSAKIMKESGYI